MKPEKPRQGDKVSADMKRALEELYKRYNNRKYVHPDPLEALYRYERLIDREIAGLVASSLAYGGVNQILRSVSEALDRMGDSPREYLEKATRNSLIRDYKGFKHRWTTSRDMASLLFGIKKITEKYGSLHDCFVSSLEEEDQTVIPALSSFVRELAGECNGMQKSLLPSPSQGSACKRLNLFLRWMVRKDLVDPGGWDDVPASKLIAPLDTHMYRICSGLEFTKRKQANMRTALEITECFRRISAEDPVRYDFALTRLGIRDDADMGSFLVQCGGSEVF